MSKTKTQLFLELACPNEEGVSRWVSTSEFVGEYADLQLGNGCDFARKSSSLRKKYKVEFDKTQTPGSRIDRIRLAGFNQDKNFNQQIRKDIWDAIRAKPCVMLGIRGFSENTTIEVDHKDGRKNDMRVSDLQTQKLSDFQPLCKAANDVKRQICQHCKETDERWDAKNIAGNPYSFYEGDKQYSPELGCIGCYQYDPVEYRIQSALMISRETTDYILDKFYPNYKKEHEE